MYKLLFRSRWYALAWALFMAASAILFATTGGGGGAWISQEQSDARERQAARESAFRSWAEDDKRRVSDETGLDPSSPEQVRDGLPPRQEPGATGGQAVPFANPGPDGDLDNGAASQ